ncbi:MAG: PQQ-dependent sugar dehydrogenase [Gammaproteobacteria bacterium]|nr:PQQ-dependent sugar dehydrogenase [Gammaproteobacteria bacterium]
MVLKNTFRLGLLLLAGCGGGGGSTPDTPPVPPPAAGAPCVAQASPPPIPDVTLQSLASGLVSPVQVTHAGDGSGRLFIVEQRGTLRVYQNGQLAGGFFLDIRTRVTAGGETGLLGLAFHPQFKTNGRFYVNYTAPGPLRTVIAEFTLGAAATLEASERQVLVINQPFSNHNGGQVAFGPDGYLYIGMGDGGSGGDPQGNGQNLATLLGKLLRIDVDRREPGLEYAVPADNPAWTAAGARREIWAYGLRNPWRFSFDPLNGELYAGDVGQNAREEIDIVKKGLNYGWNVVEGDSCYPAGAICNLALYEPPIIVHTSAAGWHSITGGVVYRGQSAPALCGVYVYADYIGGFVRALRYSATGGVFQQRDLVSLPGISSFGHDEGYEVYAVGHTSGELYKLIAR